MRDFDYARPADMTAALALLRTNPAAKPIAGGTNLLDLMKEGTERPTQLVDLRRLALAGVEDTKAGGLMIGALVTNSALAYDERVRTRYPLLSKAILAGASAQLRNMATTGGNLLQRTRCYYFYDVATPCNKRDPGSGCGAVEGRNRIHAILGASKACVATHPSDMCVALAALEAVVHVQSRRGVRLIPFADFHRLPGDTPELDTTLARDEIITAVELPRAGFARAYDYLKVRDRHSFAFALVSVAAALEVDGERIARARLALGGVAHKPWRKPGAEASLVGKAPEAAAFAAAADELLRGAIGLRDNAFKIELARRAVVRALTDAAARERSHGDSAYRQGTKPRRRPGEGDGAGEVRL